MTESASYLEARYGATAQRYPVRAASLLAVRYSGGFGLVIVVCCAEADTDPDAPAIDPMLNMILPVAEFAPAVGAEWTVRIPSLANTGIGVPPLFTDWDFHLVHPITVSVLDRRAEQYRLRLTGGIGPHSELEVDAWFDDRGIVDHDETGTYPVRVPLSAHLKSRGPWQQYITDELAFQSGKGPITEYEWTHTDRFRRLINPLFELPTVTAPPPPPGIRERLRRVFASPPPPPSPPSRTLPTPTVRQAKLLLAALLEQLLPDELCWVWDLPAVEMARVVERFADGEPTPEDLDRVARYNPKYCIIPGGMISIDPEELTRDRPPILFRMPGAISPGMCGDFFIWRLIPERSRVGCDLLRCVFGNPFRPVAFDPAWRTADVLGLARAAYDLRDFSRLPILADALQEAGCENKALLAHCRDAHVHARGCWVLDAILGPGVPM